MKYLKHIALVLAAFIAIIGIGNGIGYMITNGAGFLPVLGLVIAIVPAVLLAVKMFQEDVASPDK